MTRLSQKLSFQWVTHSLVPVILATGLYLLAFSLMYQIGIQPGFWSGFIFFFIGKISGFFLLSYLMTIVFIFKRMRAQEAFAGLTLLLKSIATTTTIAAVFTLIDIVIIFMLLSGM